MDFRPDWTETWTVRQAEHQLRFGNFKFSGPGWYFSKTDSMLIVPIGRLGTETFTQKCTDGELFLFHCWNNKNSVGQIFVAIATAPTRRDDR